MKYALIVFFVARTLAAPLILNDDLPRTEVKDVDCKSNRFPSNRAFVYEYAGETINNIEGATKLSTGLQLKARVTVTSTTECRFSMLLSNVELLSKSKNQKSFVKTPESLKFKNELERYELLFTMSGNKIYTLQTASDESIYVVNIKRGILSTLQLDESSTTETDVNGICKTEMETDGKQVTKSKNLHECSNRAQNEIGIQTATIKTETELKPLHSTSKCTYEMNDNNLINTVICTESHLFRPFSAGYEKPSGAMTIVKQSMVRITPTNVQKPTGFIKDMGAKMTMIYDHTSEETTSTNNVNGHVDQVMERLANSGKLSATQDSAHEFTTLVFLLRKMDAKRMKSTWNKYFDCVASKTCNNDDLRDVYRQYLLDAVAHCGTSTCISMVRNTILDGEVGGERMNMFLQSIALVGKTTKKMIHDVLQIVKQKPSRQAYLTLGTLLSRHCGKYPEECVSDKTSPVSKAEKYLESVLRENCPGQKKHERVEEILMALKAIGNAKRPIRIRSTLLRCAKNAQHANITRAAFDALRGMPCDRTDDVMHIITDEEIDPETRIHAFIAIMHCPSEDVLDHVVHALENEKSKQVASFIWTHLTNIMESSDPKKKEAKAILEKITKTRPLREMNLPFHKFSRAYEKSVHVDSLDSGATVEGQVIFRPDGYFPKSALMDLTANVLGTNVKLIETSIAVDGIEHFLANTIGPNGILPDNFVFNLWNHTLTYEKLKEMAQKSQRERRATNDRLGRIHDKVNMKAAEPTGTFSIKLMGQEIRVMSYDDIFWMIDQIDNMNVIQIMMNLAKGGHKTFSKSMMFLELTHTVPTSLGLPLKLKLTGSTVATVELDGKFDIRNMFWGPGALTVKGYVKPSAVVELSGQMGIDSPFVSSGVFVNSSMFFSNMMKGSVIYKEGQTFKVNLDTPEEPIQLFNFSSTPFMYINEETTLIEGAPRKINPDLCMKSKILGYGLCTSMRLPVAFREYESPYYPLSGPSHFGMKLVRGDEKLTTFQFLVTMAKEATTTTGKIEFSTPGATYERKLNGEMVYSDIESTKTLVLSTERYGKRAAVEMSYNAITHQTSLISKNNFFTPKDIITRLQYFNQTNMVSKQFGVSFSTEYDWYKFEHVTKYVRKESGYMLHSSTTYYPKKTVVGVVEYNIKDNKLSARLNSDELKQVVEVSGQYSDVDSVRGVTLTATHITSGKAATFYAGYVNKDNVKEIITTINVAGKTATNTMGYYKKDGIRSLQNYMNVDGRTARITFSYDDLKADKVLAFDADILGRKANSEIVLVNTNAEKSMKWIVNVADKVAMAKMGYYMTNDLTSLRFNVDVMGRKAELFTNIHSAEGYRTTVGGVFGKYAAGFKGVYSNNHGHGKSMCASMYYGTTESPKEPMLWCIKYHTLGKSYLHNRLTLTAEMKDMNRNAELTFDYEKHSGHVELTGKASYNNKVYAINKYSVKYNDYLNAEAKMDLTVGKYITGWKAFTETSGSTTDVGMQVYVMEKMVLFLNKYTKTYIGKTAEQQLKSQLIINGNPLPISTEFTFLHGDGITGPSMKVNIGKYSFTYASVVSYSTVEYGYGSEFVATKGDRALVKIYQRSALNMNGKKELSQKFGVSALGKTYEYGWEAAYENRGSVSKTAHAVTFRVQYATTRKSAITFTFANGKKTAELIVDFEYLPTKQVSHYIRYTKPTRQLDISIEFLPTMFAKFMVRLDKVKGYTLTTKMNLEWDNFKKAMKFVNAYTRTRGDVTLSTTLSKNIVFGVTYTKATKTLKLFANVYKFNGKIVGVLTRRNAKLRVVMNKKVLINFVGDYNRATRALTFSASNARTTWFKTSAGYNRFSRKISLTVAGAGKKQWFEVTGRYSKSGKFVMLSVLAMEKEFFKMVGKQSKDFVSLNLNSPQLGRDITFTAKLNEEEKSIVLSAEAAGTIVGLTMRGDWKNYILRLTGFVNKMESGIQMHLEKHAFVYKMMFTPSASAQVIFEVQDDKILKMTVQRTMNNKVTNETAFVYRLNNGICQLMFKWNPQTIMKVTDAVSDLIKPLAEKIMAEMNKFSTKAVTISKKFVEESARDSRKAAINFLNKMDQTFDEFDFVGVRDQVGEVTLKTLRELSRLIRTALKEAAKGLDSFKENLPAWIHKSRTLSASAQEMISTMKVDLTKNLKQLNAIVMVVVKNLTESTRPVVNKAIELIKDFKFRGKTMQELTVLVKDMAKKYYAVYTERAQILFADIKVKSLKYYNDARVYVLKMKIPYRDETVEEVIEITLNKAEELKQKLNDVDLKKLIEKVRVTVMNYNIQGKPVKEHIVLLKKDLKNLPEATRKALLELIRLTRVYSKEVKAAFNKVIKFAEPATNHVIFVGKTIKKHFGPAFDDAVTKFARKIYVLELPSLTPYVTKQWAKIEAFFLPLMEPMTPLYNKLMQQVRQIKVMGFRVGPLFDIQMETMMDSVDTYMKKSTTMLKTQIEKLGNYVETVSAMTPEQMVDNIFDKSTKLSENAVEYITKLYREREVMMKKLMSQINKTYKDMQTQYKKYTAKPVEEMMEVMIHRSSESLMAYAEELSALLKQLAGMDIAGPTWKAWKEADVIGHLRKYGVNDKIMNAIQTAKDVKLTETVLEVIKRIENFVKDVYTKTYTKAMQTYAKVDNVVKYIKSIPKKEYEEWFNELKDFTLKNKETVVNYLTKTYRISKERATQLYTDAKKMSLKNYNTLVKDVAKNYVEPTKDMYDFVATKSVLVYNEVKQPTIDVTNHYRTIATKFVKENYDIVYSKLMQEYNKVSVQLKEKFAELNKRMEDEYEKFLNKYGDMTWEEIGDKVYKYGDEKREVAQKMIKKYTAELTEKTLKLKKQAEELYKVYYGKAMVEYRKYKTMAEDKYMEIKPKVLKMYNDYKTMAETQYLKALLKTNEMYSDIKAKVTEIYNNNKDKTLKQLYLEIKEILIEQYNKQYKLTSALINKKSTEIKSLVNKYYAKADTAMRTIILPEIKMEVESLINQTLRGSVVLANETVKAYYPHFVLVKDTLQKAAVTLKLEAVIAYKKSVAEMKKQLDKLITILKELLVKIQNHELYNKAINHEYVVKATKKTKELIKITQEKIEELKTHPTTLKYKKQVEEKLAEYKQQLAEYKVQLEELYKKYSQHPTSIKAKELMKQIQKSAMYTYTSLIKKVIPQFEFAANMMHINVKNLPDTFNAAFIFFRQHPEEAFWYSVCETQTAAKDMYTSVKTLNMKTLKAKAKFYSDMTRVIGDSMLDECFDEWTKTTAKNLYNDAIKTFEKTQQRIKELPEELKQMIIKSYNKNLAKMTKWTKEQYRTVVAEWKKSPFPAFVNNRLWKELADEFMDHELVELTRTLATMTKEKAIELKAIVLKEFAKQRAIFAQKFTELKFLAMDKYDELKSKSIAQYEELVQKYKDLVKKAEKFVEETTIADIVRYTKQQYETALRKYEEAKEKLIKLRVKYTAEAKRLYAKYEMEARKMYKENYAKAEALVLKYKEKMMPYYIKYRAQAMKVYNKYYPIVMAKYNELYMRAEELYKKAQDKYVVLRQQAIAQYEELKIKSTELFKEYKAKATTMMDDAKTQWMDSEVRAKLIALKKMSIRETIEALKKLPKQTRTLVIQTYTKYYKMAMERYQKEYERFMQKYQELVKQLLAKRAELEKMLKPYTVPAMEAYKWIENEVTETAVFIYRYHKLAERYNKAKQYIISEYKRVTPMIPTTLNKYAKQCQALTIKYARDYSILARDYAEKMLSKAGHGTLRGIHSSLRYIDSIDMKDIRAKGEAYLNFVKKYISIDTKKGEFIISIPCGATPSFNYHIKKVQGRVRRSVKDIKEKSNAAMEKIKSELESLKLKAEKLKDQLKKQIMENTVEIRKDLKSSFNVNKRIVERAYSKAKILAQKSYNRAIRMYRLYKPKAMKLYQQAKRHAKLYYKTFLRMADMAFLQSKQTMWKAYNAGPVATYNDLMVFVPKTFKDTKNRVIQLYKTNKPIVIKNVNKYMAVAKTNVNKAKKALKPYYNAVETAVLKVKNGTPLKEAFYPIYREIVFATKFYQQQAMDKMRIWKKQACRADLKLCRLVKEAVNVHTDIYMKYSGRVFDMVGSSKAHVYRFIRLAKNRMQGKTMCSAQAYTDIAMIFGNDHILTFDNKFYDIPQIKHPECKYLLAHDFADGKFEIIKQKDAVLIQTPEMMIKIRADGTIKANVGNKAISQLPVESGSSKCIRKAHEVICHFAEQKIRVNVNLNYFYTRVSMSGWHFGKSQGLLGTNNRESYDDMKLPNGRITKNIFKFFNAYELTGRPKCQLSKMRLNSCKKQPSTRCAELFQSKTSPFARFFSSVNPEAFLQACQADTANCDKKINHCSSAAAYVSMARARSNWIKHLPECLSVESHSVNDKWVQSPLKRAVDVVFMMSQRRNIFSSRKSVEKMLQQLQRLFKRQKLNPRYTLIGFGGKGIHERAHSHPLGTGSDVFGSVSDLIKAIDTMPYEGTGKTSNDAYHAILTASQTRFRPGASKVFIMYNTEPHSSHEHGPEYDEALYVLKKEADAALFVFDKFDFKHVAGAGRILGQTSRKIYTTRHITGLPQSTEIPQSEFTNMAQSTNGGWFQSRIKNPKQVATALSNAIGYHVKVQSNLCKKCTLEPTYSDVSRPICQSNAELKC